jgi:hypothetical protein
MDKKTEKYLLIGGAVLVVGYLWYQNQQAASAAAAAASTPTGVTTATSATLPAVATSAAAAPAIDPTQAIEFSIQAIGALNQPIYIFAAQFAITNTSSEDITVDGFQGTFYFPYQMGDYYQDTKPDSIGLLGTYTSPANITVPANSTVMNWVQAVVPKTSAANFWLTMVADANAYATIHNAAKGYLTFSGTATIEGAQVPLNVKYL